MASLFCPGFHALTDKPISIEELKLRFTEARMVSTVPTGAGLKKWIPSIETVVTLDSECLKAAVQATLSINETRCPPNKKPYELLSLGCTISVDSTIDSCTVFASILSLLGIKIFKLC